MTAKDSLETTFKLQQMETELRESQMRVAQLRQVIAFAMCAECGEPINDIEWTIADTHAGERLVHAVCAPDEEDY